MPGRFPDSRYLKPGLAADSVSNSIQNRLDAFRQLRRAQAGSLIISVFGDAILPRGGRIWLGSLIRLLEPLEVNERLIRTSVFRLAKDEWLCTETCGRRANYALTAAGRRRFDEASRHIYASHAPCWDHRWRLILVVGELAPKMREKLRRALFWQGFGVLGDCFVHPGAELPAVMEALVAEGLADALGALLPLLAADARSVRSASDAELVGRAWDLGGLAEAYGGFVAVYQGILADLQDERAGEISEQDAFLLRTLLIHDYRRLLLRDPELPEVLLPVGWPGEQARRLCQALYKRLAPLSSRYLDKFLCLADGSFPPVDTSLAERFPMPDRGGA